MSEHTGRIRPENLAACLSLLASVGETQLDAALQGEVEGGLEHADFGSGHLYEFALGKLAAAVAEGDAGEIYFRVQAPHGFGRAVQVVLLAGAQYHLAR